MELGYRTEDLYGEGFRNVSEVMAHEVFNLENTDILETLSATILKGTKLGEKLERMSQVISGEIDDNEIDEMLDEYFEKDEKGINFFDEVIQEINNITKTNIKYCLWLCDSIQDIIDSYDDINGDNSFDAYEKSSIILSNMCKYGKLYGYEHYPMPVLIRD